MSRMRSSVSKKNKWWIPSERYLELKHFCLQYDLWQSEIHNGMIFGLHYGVPTGRAPFSDPTAEEVIRYEELQSRCDLINRCLDLTDSEIKRWLKSGVISDASYDNLKARGIPCGKDYYYEAYHKFFYILDKERK